MRSEGTIGKACVAAIDPTRKKLSPTAIYYRKQRMRDGTRIAVSSPFNPIPTAAKAAPDSLRDATCAAAMPLPATPAAKP